MSPQKERDPSKKRVLFVCMGNICRSPTGEGVLKKRVHEAGLDEAIDVDSAGTIAYHAGERADPRMREAAARRGYTLDSRARPFRRDDFDNFDLIIAMDRKNLDDIKALDADGTYDDKLRLLSSFIADTTGRWPPDVPDPYYGGPAGFEEVLDMIEAATGAILDTLRP